MAVKTQEEKALSYRRSKWLVLLGAPLGVAVALYLHLRSHPERYLPPAEAARYERIVEAVRELSGCTSPVCVQRRAELEREVARLRNRIPLTTVGLLRTPGGPRLLAFLVVVSVLGLWMPVSVVRRHRGIFLQKPSKEVLFKHGTGRPMLLLDVLGFDEEWVVSEFFGTKENWNAVWDAFNSLLMWDEVRWEPDGRTPEEVRQRAVSERKVVLDVVGVNEKIAEHLPRMEKLFRLAGVLDDRSLRRAKFVVAFVLVHFVGVFFGNVSTALLSRYVPDYTLRRVLALYLSGCTVVASPGSKDWEAHLILHVFQVYRKLHGDVLVEFEKLFSYLPPDYVVYRTYQRKRSVFGTA